MLSSRHRKSEHTRREVLDAALELFSHHGYRATAVKDIAEAAGVSTGNVYHHFPDKEAIFRTLLDEYAQITRTPKFPLTRVLDSERFPDNLEQIARATRESVQQYRNYIALYYVDMIEFDGTHIRNFFGDIATRFAARGDNDQIAARLRAGVSPTTALQIVAHIFFNYFQLETLFGVSEPFGADSPAVVRQIVDIVLHGIA